MKKGMKKRLMALLCVMALVFCDVGSVLAENNVTLPVAEDNQDNIELPDDDFTESPDDGTPEEPDQPAGRQDKTSPTDDNPVWNTAT